MLSRRNFVKTTSLASMTFASSCIAAKTISEPFDKMEKGPTLKKVTVFAGSGSFYRFIGPNSYDEKPKGIHGHTRRTVLVELSDGTLGMGTVGYRTFNDKVLEAIRPLLGKDIFSFYQWKAEKIIGVSPATEKYFLEQLMGFLASFSLAGFLTHI